MSAGFSRDLLSLIDEDTAIVDYIFFVANTLFGDMPLRWQTFGTKNIPFDALTSAQVEQLLVVALARSDTHAAKSIRDVSCRVEGEGTIVCDVTYAGGNITLPVR